MTDSRTRAPDARPRPARRFGVPVVGFACLACLAAGCADEPDPECATEPVLFEPGCFIMGEYEEVAFPRQNFGSVPRHEVCITRGLIVQPFEVTVEEWLEHFPAPEGAFSACADCAVTGVTWFEALAFANADSEAVSLPPCYDLSRCTGSVETRDLLCPADITFSLDCAGWRLPTEAEWEYVARAGDDRSWPCDYESTPECMDRYAQTSSDRTSDLGPVGARLPNAAGLCDVLGSAYEWVWDRVEESRDSYYTVSPRDDPMGVEPDGRVFRIKRGGSWNDTAGDARYAHRHGVPPTYTAMSDIGLRLVRTPDANIANGSDDDGSR